MRAAVLTIGTELTRGELVDRNSAFLADHLTALGIPVTEMVTVDDDDERIESSLKRLSVGHEVILITGGLGPTTDDRTSACAARALGVPLVRNFAAHAELVRLLTARGRSVTPSNGKQADFPQGATVLENTEGTAPGFSVQLGRATCFFLPGVPTEMRVMFEAGVIPRLPAPKARLEVIVLRTFGLPEAEVNDRLAGLEEEHGVTLGYRASQSEIEVKIFAAAQAGEASEATRRRAETVEKEVRARLGAAVYGAGKVSLPEALGALLLEKSLSFGVAESCTGGLVSHLMTEVPGASRYFRGGITSYDNSIKTALLGVSTATLAEYGAVSEAVARQMAEGARERLGVDVALSLTGIAGPDGGTTEKPVGLVHYAVATARDTTVHRAVFSGDRSRIQRRAALNGLWAVRAALLI